MLTMEERLIYESPRSKIFLTKDAHGKNGILKLLNSDFPTPKDVAQFNNELSITSDLNIPGVRRVISSLKSNNKHALNLEWFDGITFAEAFKSKQNDILDFLTIGVEISKVLTEIHQEEIIHQDISPFNILINLLKKQI